MIVDSAAFVPTSRLDLSAWKPDFAPVSFYKMFGYPTGLGALLARRPALDRLKRPWFSGGTVVAANIQGEMVVPLSGHALFEDGTVNYLGIPAVEIGLRHIERIGIDTIAQRVEGLGTWLLEELQRLRHSDGSPATRLYGPTTWDRRGATIAFNFLHPDGRVIDERFVDVVAAEHRISVRTGCFCNSGAGETAFSLSRDTLIGAEFDDGMILDDYIRLIGMPTGGAVRVSLGLATNFADVYRFMRFATEFRDVADVPAGLPRSLACNVAPESAAADPAMRRPRPLKSQRDSCGLRPAWRRRRGLRVQRQRNTKARGQPGVRPERLAQRRHQIAVDHVEERVRAGVLAVEEPLERLLREPQQERPLARRRGHGRRAAVDQALVAERLPGAGEPDPDPAAAADDDLLDGAVDRQVARRRDLALGDQRAPGRAAGEPPGGQDPPERERVERAERRQPAHVAAVGRPAELELGGGRRRLGPARSRRATPRAPRTAGAGARSRRRRAFA